MNYLEALEQLQLLDIEQLTLLEQAHWRYVAFMGICCPDDAYQHQAILDRQTYPQWHTHTDTGHPCITDEEVAGFMSAVSHIPPEVCLAWNEVDFCQTFGTHYREHLAQGESL
ncbi:hypothetical protein WH06_23260 [Aeromonas salmonicida subsp. salmonicida]|uniref:Uncharacterized protein n=2 Tax=Aeromonas salmonicida subsp. salmonicida TaxID=29491 RepID=A0A1Z3MNL9_AERSS|nr:MULTISPECIES: hypothetical protein [Aeromonas]ASD49382.1 hypothetical protein [Aeromonas salmonicida subsp. salmonicida]OAH74985.1 hypothetical protein AXW81_13770 [Aeromonas salmonicida subsp. salmonicida]OKA73174.1 hypothetical protein BHR40_23185 [Aeromonas salmonicida subsp. salmonicida]OSM50248.1 hypothetical protein WH06_23260 [Aeromonas salmonicida subsp. salmonicida]QEO86308.1 hypothetical protein E3D14_23625 [Aeromonas salmonicida subsp. salmonicida]